MGLITAQQVLENKKKLLEYREPSWHLCRDRNTLKEYYFMFFNPEEKYKEYIEKTIMSRNKERIQRKVVEGVNEKKIVKNLLSFEIIPENIQYLFFKNFMAGSNAKRYIRAGNILRYRRLLVVDLNEKGEIDLTNGFKAIIPASFMTKYYNCVDNTSVDKKNNLKLKTYQKKFKGDPENRALLEKNHKNSSNYRNDFFPETFHAVYYRSGMDAKRLKNFFQDNELARSMIKRTSKETIESTRKIKGAFYNFKSNYILNFEQNPNPVFKPENFLITQTPSEPYIWEIIEDKKTFFKKYRLLQNS